MTEADILALTYQDSCWVYRPQKTTLPSGCLLYTSDAADD